MSTPFTPELAALVNAAKRMRDAVDADVQSATQEGDELDEELVSALEELDGALEAFE